MNNPIHLRPARVEDAAGIARVHVDTWRTSYGGIVPAEHLAKMDYAERTQRWRARLSDANDPAFTFVAETDAGEIVGFAVGMPERENDPVYHGELGGLYLLQAYQRQGIGRRLVIEVVRRLRDLGFTNLLIWALAENPACGFYAALGGKPVRAKTVVIGGKELREVGFGWDTLTGLLAMEQKLIFLKLGGSAITDKTRQATARADVIRDVARQVAQARRADPTLQILIGHGSGSFGHFAAKKFGFGARDNWRAYAETGAAAARLNRLVTDLFLAADVPVVALQPSASARCRDGALIDLAVAPIQAALASHLVPLVFGDVAFDETRGMAIASTEMLFAHLAPILTPTRIILAGIVDGVFTADPLQNPNAELIREITPANFARIEAQLRGSHGVDVTGGMIGKVRTMLALVERQPRVQAQIVSAVRANGIAHILAGEEPAVGTCVHA